MSKCRRLHLLTIKVESTDLRVRVPSSCNSPNERITPTQALQHPFLESLRRTSPEFEVRALSPHVTFCVIGIR